MRLPITILVFCVGALLALGLTILFSAELGDTAQYFRNQLLWCCIALPAALVAAAVPYQQLRRWWWLVLLLSVALLVLVFLKGKSINGARRWLGPKGGPYLQPSEFAKIALIIALAWYGERFRDRMRTFLHGVLIPGAGVGLVLGLVFLEPDVGTTLLMACVAATLLLTAGARLSFFLPPVVVGLVGVGLFIARDPMRSDRIHSWLNLEETRLNVGHQAFQAQVAIGAGGITGRGLGEGRQKLGWVPEHHTDFIFSVVAEELGLVGGGLVLLAYIGIIITGTWIALNAADVFGSLIAMGVTTLIGVQTFINVGVVTGTLPNKGLALPFMSYGGSSLLFMLTAVGLLLNVAREARSSGRRHANTGSNPFSDEALSEAV
jgi:cell division protein FtsW